jgi:hypothetical protein
MSSRLPITAIVFALLPATVAAQGVELNRDGRSGFAIEALRPTIDGGGTSIFSAAYFLSGHMQLGSGARLVAELPVGHASSTESDFEGGNSTRIGNPYLGVQFGKGSTTFEVGGRLPLSGDFDSATGIAMLGDVTRMEAFAPKLASLRASFRLDAPLSPTWTAGFQVAPMVWVPTGDNESDNEVLLGYGAGVGYHTTSLRFQGRVVGRAIMTESDIDFSERTFHQLGLAADFGSGAVRPGIYVARPLDEDFSEEVKTVFGITLQIVTK